MPDRNMTMRCGLFGKIGAKRDFIAIATPRSFLEAWEPWVQSALSASRHQLGPGWQQAFLTAPVWRFWLGAAICGTTVAGAMMPSLDGVWGGIIH
ncbi:type VI secretion system ImpM family protein [Bradyrhizobium liaoningense]